MVMSSPHLMVCWFGGFESPDTILENTAPDSLLFNGDHKCSVEFKAEPRNAFVKAESMSRSNVLNKQ